jgi:hypothetical protein
MKLLPLVGIGLVIWGMASYDWYKAQLGALLFVIYMYN